MHSLDENIIEISITLLEIIYIYAVNLNKKSSQVFSCLVEESINKLSF